MFDKPDLDFSGCFEEFEGDVVGALGGEGKEDACVAEAEGGGDGLGLVVENVAAFVCVLTVVGLDFFGFVWFFHIQINSRNFLLLQFRNRTLTHRKILSISKLLQLLLQLIRLRNRTRYILPLIHKRPLRKIKLRQTLLFLRPPFSIFIRIQLFLQTFLLLNLH